LNDSIGYFGCLGFAVTPASNSAQFTYEAYTCLEYVSGSNTLGTAESIVLGQTDSHSDILGLSATQAVIQQPEVRRPHRTQMDLEENPRTAMIQEAVGVSWANMLKPLVEHVVMPSLPTVGAYVGAKLRHLANPMGAGTISHVGTEWDEL